MGNKIKSFGLVGLGMVAGIAASMQFSAIAQKPMGTPLPLEEGQGIRLALSGRRLVTLHFTARSVGMEASTDEQGGVSLVGFSAAVKTTLEAAIPLAHFDTDGEPMESVGLVCEIYEHGHPTERFPQQGEVLCPLVPVQRRD